MSVGTGLPGNVGGGNIFAELYVMPLGESLVWNAYGAADATLRYWSSGVMGGLSFSEVGYVLDIAPSGGAGQVVQPGSATPLFVLSQAGALELPHGTLTVARDPATPSEVATMGWVGKSTVASFNQRNGAVQLNAQDVYSALKLCDPLATQPWVNQAIQNSIQNLLYTCPFVNTWNGRQGQVYLMLSDITCVFYQSGQQPISPTPIPTSNDDSIATTRWVTDIVSPLDVGGSLSVVNVLNYGAVGNGTTDDTNAIQTTLNAFAGKSIIFIPDIGSSYMVNSLVVPSGTMLQLDGTLMLRAGNSNGVLVLQGVGDITIGGNGTIDGNGAVQTQLTAGMNVGNCTNITIKNITIRNAGNVTNGGWNLNVTGSQRVILDGVSLIGGQSANEFAAASDDCWLVNSLIDGPNADDGFAFYGGVTNSGITNCTIRNAAVAGNAGDAGIFVLADSGQPAPCKNILIANNIVYNSSGAGIAVDLAAPGLHEAVTITGNRVYDSNNIGQTGQSQIYIGGVTGCIVSGNMISALDPINQCSYGIHLRGSTGVSVTGNFIFDMGSATEPGFGVWVDSPNVVLVDGNTFHDYRSTSYMTAIGGTAGINNRFSNNLFGDLTATVTVTPQPDTVLPVPVADTTDDATAALMGVPVGGQYRNGSQLMVRVA